MNENDFEQSINIFKQLFQEVRFKINVSKRETMICDWNGTRIDHKYSRNEINIKEDSRYIGVWISYKRFTKRDKEIDQIISDARCINPKTLT